MLALDLLCANVDVGILLGEDDAGRGRCDVVMDNDIFLLSEDVKFECQRLWVKEGLTALSFDLSLYGLLSRPCRQSRLLFNQCIESVKQNANYIRMKKVAENDM
jgi:hypothetical protein